MFGTSLKKQGTSLVRLVIRWRKSVSLESQKYSEKVNVKAVATFFSWLTVLMFFQNCSQQKGIGLLLNPSSGVQSKISSTSAQDLDEEGKPFSLQIHFDEPVETLDASMLEVTNAKILKVEGSGQDFIVQLEPTALEVSLQVKAGMTVKKGTKKKNAESNVLVKRVGAVSPQVVLSTVIPELTAIDNEFEILATFSRSYTPKLEEFRTLNLKLKTLAIVDDPCNCKFKFIAEPTTSNTGDKLSIQFPEKIFSNKWSQYNLASNALDFTFTAVPPTVLLTSEAPSTVSNEFEINLTLSIPDSFLAHPLNSADLDITGGEFVSLQKAKEISGEFSQFKYILRIRPMADLIRVTAKDGILKNKFGQFNAKSNLITRNYVNELFKITFPDLKAVTPLVTSASQNSYKVEGTCPFEGSAVNAYTAVKPTLNVSTGSPCSGGKFSILLNLSNEPEGPVSITLRTSHASGETASTGFSTSKTLGIAIVIEQPLPNSQVTTNNAKAFKVAGSCTHPGGIVSVKATNQDDAVQATQEVVSTCSSLGAFEININFVKFDLQSGFKLTNGIYKIKAQLTEPPLAGKVQQTASYEVPVQRAVVRASPSATTDGPYYIMAADGATNQITVDNLTSNDKAEGAEVGQGLSLVSVNTACKKCQSVVVSNSQVSYTSKTVYSGQKTHSKFDSEAYVGDSVCPVFDPSALGLDEITYVVADEFGLTSQGTLQFRIVTPYTWIGKSNGIIGEKKNWCGVVSADKRSCLGASSAPDLNSALVVDEVLGSFNPSFTKGRFCSLTQIGGQTEVGVLESTELLIFPHRILVKGGKFTATNIPGSVLTGELSLKEGSEFYSPATTAVNFNLNISDKKSFVHNNGNLRLPWNSQYYGEVLVSVPNETTFGSLNQTCYGCQIKVTEQNDPLLGKVPTHIYINQHLTFENSDRNGYGYSQKFNSGAHFHVHGNLYLNKSGGAGTSLISLDGPSGSNQKIIGDSRDQQYPPLVGNLYVNSKGAVEFSSSLGILSKLILADSGGSVSTKNAKLKVDHSGSGGPRIEFSVLNPKADLYFDELLFGNAEGIKLQGLIKTKDLLINTNYVSSTPNNGCPEYERLDPLNDGSGPSQGHIIVSGNFISKGDGRSFGSNDLVTISSTSPTALHAIAPTGCLPNIEIDTAGKFQFAAGTTVIDAPKGQIKVLNGDLLMADVTDSLVIRAIGLLDMNGRKFLQPVILNPKFRGSGKEGIVFASEAHFMNDLEISSEIEPDNKTLGRIDGSALVAHGDVRIKAYGFSGSTELKISGTTPQTIARVGYINNPLVADGPATTVSNSKSSFVGPHIFTKKFTITEGVTPQFSEEDYIEFKATMANPGIDIDTKGVLIPNALIYGVNTDAASTTKQTYKYNMLSPMNTTNLLLGGQAPNRITHAILGEKVYVTNDIKWISETNGHVSGGVDGWGNPFMAQFSPSQTGSVSGYSEIVLTGSSDSHLSELENVFTHRTKLPPIISIAKSPGANVYAKTSLTLRRLNLLESSLISSLDTANQFSKITIGETFSVNTLGNSFIKFPSGNGSEINSMLILPETLSIYDSGSGTYKTSLCTSEKYMTPGNNCYQAKVQIFTNNP